MRTIYALIFGRSLLWHSLYFFLPVLLIERGVSAGWRGVLLAVLTVSGVLFTAIAGLLSDRLSPRPVIACGMVASAVYLAGLAGLANPWALAGAFVVGGLAWQLTQIGSEAYVYKHLESGREARGLAWLLASSMLAMALGLAAGGALLGTGRTVTVVAGAAAAFAVLAAATLLLARLPAVRVAPKVYGRDLLQRRALWLLAFCVLTRLHWGAELACYAPFLEAELGLGRGAAGLFMAGPIALIALGSLWTGTRLDRGVRSGPLLLVGTALAGVGQIAFTVPESVGGALAWRVVHEIGEAAVLVIVMHEVGRLFPRDRVGGPVGAFWLVSNLAMGLGALGSSLLADAWGNALPQQIGGALMLLALTTIPGATSVAGERD